MPDYIERLVAYNHTRLWAKSDEAYMGLSKAGVRVSSDSAFEPRFEFTRALSRGECKVELCVFLLHAASDAIARAVKASQGNRHEALMKT